MGLQRGRNRSGFTGLIDLPGLGTGVKFYADIVRWSHRQDGASRPRRGRGGGRYATYRWILGGGSGSASGDLQTSGWPAPSTWQGEEGTITVQVDTSKTIAIPIKVGVCDISFDTTKKVPDDIPKVAFTWTATGPMVFTGWSGTQPTAATQSKSDLQLWEGTSWTVDANALASSGQVVVDWWDAGVTDTNAAEITKLAAIVAAFSPPSPYKKRPATIVRDATDGGTITIPVGLTDTKDDEEMPSTPYAVDAAGIFGQVSITKIQDTSTISWPTTPTEPADLKHGKVDKIQRNDGKWRLTYNFVRNNSQDTIEFEGAHESEDPDDLGETARIIVVTDSATPPSVPAAPVGQHVETDTRQLTDTNGSYTGYWAHTFDYAPTTRKQAIEQEGEVSFISDGYDIASEQTQVLTHDTLAGTPADPVAQISGHVCYRRLSKKIQDTPEKWRTTFFYEFRNPGSKLEAGNTQTNLDVSGLKSTATTAEMFDKDSPPSTPTLSGYVLRFQRDLETANPQYRLRIYEWGLTSTEEDITFPESKKKTGTSLGVQNWQFVAEITASATPSAPANPDATNLSYHSTESHQLTDGGKWVHVHAFAPLTAEEDIEADGTETVNDSVSSLAGDDRETVFTNSSTPPSAPSHSPRVCVKVVTRRKGKSGYAHSFFYDFRSRANQHIAERTKTMVDASGLESEAFTAEVYLVSGGPAGAGSAPFTNAVNVDYTDIEIENQLYRLRVYGWALTTNAQKIEFRENKSKGSVLEPYDRETATIVAWTDTADALVTSLVGSNQSLAGFISASATKLTPAKALQIIATMDNDNQMIPGNNHVVEQEVNGLPSSAIISGPSIDPNSITFGDTVGKVLVFVPGPPLLSGSYTEVFVRDVPIWRAIGTFQILRVYADDDVADHQYLALRGCVNNAAFCGYSEGEAMYAGPAAAFNFTVSGSRRVAYIYQFYTDNYRHFSPALMSSGRAYPNDVIGSPVPSAGFYDSADLDAGYGPIWPEEASFAGFIS